MSSVQVSLIPSPDLASPRSLPSPPPSRISTKAQATSQELVGSNDRRSESANELDLSPRQSKQIPHILGNKLIIIVKECYNIMRNLLLQHLAKLWWRDAIWINWNKAKVKIA